MNRIIFVILRLEIRWNDAGKLLRKIKTAIPTWDGVFEKQKHGFPMRDNGFWKRLGTFPMRNGRIGNPSWQYDIVSSDLFFCVLSVPPRQ